LQSLPGTIIAVKCENYMKYINILFGKEAEFFMLQHAVYIVTTFIKDVKELQI
jgi:hypothetical protein